MPWLAWSGCGRVSWTPDARVRVSQWLHSHAATKAFPCLDMERADPCHHLKVTQTIFLLANGTNAASSSLGKRPTAPEIFRSLADTTGRNAPKASSALRRDVGSSSSSPTKAAKTHAVPLCTSRKAYFRSPPRISLEFSVAVCRTTSKTPIFAASLHHLFSLGPAAIGFPPRALMSVLCRPVAAVCATTPATNHIASGPCRVLASLVGLV